MFVREQRRLINCIGFVREVRRLRKFIVFVREHRKLRIVWFLLEYIGYWGNA